MPAGWVSSLQKEELRPAVPGILVVKSMGYWRKGKAEDNATFFFWNAIIAIKRLKPKGKHNPPVFK